MTDTIETPVAEAPKPAPKPQAKIVEVQKPKTVKVKKFVPEGAEDTGEMIELPLRDGVRFIRDFGNKNRDGSPFYQEYGEAFTDDVCPSGLPGHDICEVLFVEEGNKTPSQQNGKLVVQCAYCHAPMISKYDVPEPPAAV